MAFHSFSRSELARCDCCPRGCGVDRTRDETGVCGIGERAQVAHYGLHFGEEPPICGQRGSGTIFFSGCNLRCVFCQNHQISRAAAAIHSREYSNEELAGLMLELEARGAHNLNLVSPSHVIFQLADAIEIAKARGLRLPIVYNSGGYDSVAALRRIDGLVDIYLPDLKYASSRLAKEFSLAPDYPKVAQAAIREMFAQVGLLNCNRFGIARRGLLVRHLVLPGQVEDSKRCLRFLATLSPELHLSIMSQYAPRYRASAYPALNRSLSVTEYDEITDYALELGLENAFVQDLTSQESCVPDFERERPFRFESDSEVEIEPTLG